MGRAELDVITSGVDGLDTLLNGGYVSGRLYLVQGQPGTGKSLLGQHFLEAGLQNGETVLYIHGEEQERNIEANATQLGIDLTDADFLDLGPETDFFTEDVSYDLVNPADVASERFIDDIRDVVERVGPSRVFVDPITQLRYIETDEYHYRKRLLAFMRFFESEDITVVASRTRERGTQSSEEIESVSDGVVNLYPNGGEMGGRGGGGG